MHIQRSCRQRQRRKLQLPHSKETLSVAASPHTRLPCHPTQRLLWGNTFSLGSKGTRRLQRGERLQKESWTEVAFSWPAERNSWVSQPLVGLGWLETTTP